MTVYELIRVLETHPPDLRVMVQGYEDGYDDLEPRFIKAADVRLNVNTDWYYGRHEEVFAGDKHEDSPTARALIFRRPWHDHKA